MFRVLSERSESTTRVWRPVLVHVHTYNSGIIARTNDKLIKSGSRSLMSLFYRENVPRWERNYYYRGSARRFNRGVTLQLVHRIILRAAPTLFRSHFLRSSYQARLRLFGIRPRLAWHGKKRIFSFPTGSRELKLKMLVRRGMNESRCRYMNASSCIISIWVTTD